MSTQLDLIAQAITTSREQLVLAESEQWDALSDLEQTRQDVIKQIDLSQVEEGQQQQVIEQMTALVSLNEQLESFCREKRSEAITELTKINQGLKVKKAYS